MACTIFLRNLAFLSLSASFILALWLPEPASAARPTQAASDLSGLHCKLWMQQNEGQPLGMTAYELSLMLNRPVTEEEANALRYQYGSIPDFGFVLEKYWEVATRQQRFEFNRLFSRLLNHDFPLNTAHENEFCTMNVSITRQDPRETARAGGADMPQPRRFNGIAETASKPDEEKPLKARYLMRQNATGWGLEDIMLNGQSLKSTYAVDLQKYIRQGGYKALLGHLAEEVQQRDIEAGTEAKKADSN